MASSSRPWSPIPDGSDSEEVPTCSVDPGCLRRVALRVHGIALLSGLILLSGLNPGRVSMAGTLPPTEKNPLPGSLSPNRASDPVGLRERAGQPVGHWKPPSHRPGSRPCLLFAGDPDDDEVSDDPDPDDDDSTWDDYQCYVGSDGPIMACLGPIGCYLPLFEGESAPDPVAPPSASFLTRQRLRC
jgi:hypothetical protein